MPHPSTNYLIARVRDFCRWQEKLFGDPSSRGEPVTHRIRESMSDASTSTIGGDNKVVEADETYVGGKAKNRAYKPEPKKHIIMSLVERGGEVRSFHVKNATAKTTPCSAGRNSGTSLTPKLLRGSDASEFKTKRARLSSSPFVLNALGR